MASKALVLATALALGGCAHAGLSGPDPVAALPLTELPAAGAGERLAVFYSGDAGWSALDRGVSQQIAAAGTPVVGLNSLRYFWRARTPEGAAADLAAIIEAYAARWGRPRVILVGYSFGADALPILIPYLPAETRQRLDGLALISAFSHGELRFHFGSWLNKRRSDAFPLAPRVDALRGLPMVCVYGEKEAAALCPHLPPDLIRQVQLPGGHKLDGAYGEVADAILKAAP